MNDVATVTRPSKRVPRKIAKTGTDVALADNPESLLTAIVRMARDPAVDVQKLGALLDMQERLENRQRETAFNEAFARLQPRLPRIKKNGEVKYPVNKNNPEGPQKHAFHYARWEDIDDAIRPIMNEEGFSFSVDTAPHAGGGVMGTGTLMHIGGHSRSASIGPVPLDTSGGKNNLQAAGSTTSYIARYTAKMLLNLVFEGEDDDGVHGGAQPISRTQVGDLVKLVDETKSDLDAFLRFMDVAALADIQVDNYPKAINALMAKKRRIQEQQMARAPSGRSSKGQDTGIAAELQPGNPEMRVRVPPDSTFAIAPVQGKRGFDWKATGHALLSRAKLITDPADFDRLRRESRETIELLRRADKAVWSDWNFASGQLEQALREKASS